MAVVTEWSDDWAQLFTSLDKELEYEITEIEGSLPSALRGTWFRTGPGILERGGMQIPAVDSDGMVCRITLDGNGKAFFKNRYVRTDGFVKEVQAGKALFRGVFGTLPAEEENLRGTMMEPQEFMKMQSKPYKNVSNTSLLILPNSGKMLSMWEGGLPYSMDPESLETLGIENLGGILQPTSIFSAHPCLEEKTQRLVNFGVIPGMVPKASIWEFDVSGSEAKLVQEHSFELKDQCVIHDLCITPKWAVLVHNPVSFNVQAAMTRGASIDDFLTRESSSGATTRVIIVPRDPSLLGGTAGGVNGLYAEYEFENNFTYHHANAYEETDGSIVIDSVVYDQKPDLDVRNVKSRIELNTVCGRGRLMRYRMQAPRAAGEVPGRGGPELLPGSPPSCEMPTARSSFQGQPRRFIYAVDMMCDEASARPWAALLKSDVHSGTLQEWRAPARCYVGEPCFAPGPGSAEDDGWVLQLMFDVAKGRSALLILDAKDVAAGPVCTLWLRHHVPLSTHTMWTERLYGLLPAARL